MTEQHPDYTPYFHFSRDLLLLQLAYSAQGEELDFVHGGDGHIAVPLRDILLSWGSLGIGLDEALVILRGWKDAGLIDGWGPGNIQGPCDVMFTRKATLLSGYFHDEDDLDKWLA